MLKLILCKCPIALAFIAFVALTLILTTTLSHNTLMAIEIQELKNRQKNETFTFLAQIGDFNAQISSYKEEADTAKIEKLQNETFRFRIQIQDYNAQISSYKEQADKAKRDYEILKNETMEMEEQYIMKLNTLTSIIQDVHLKLTAAESNIEYSDKKLVDQSGDFNKLKDMIMKNIQKFNKTDVTTTESTAKTIASTTRRRA